MACVSLPSNIIDYPVLLYFHRRLGLKGVRVAGYRTAVIRLSASNACRKVKLQSVFKFSLKRFQIDCCPFELCRML